MSNKKATTDDIELELLRNAIDKSEKKIGSKAVQSESNILTMKIVENFIKMKKLVCYGGTAINNILPKESQFYDKSYELPDYDFFSYNALNHSKELANIFVGHGFESVEVRTAMNIGTFKVFVNFLAVADITEIDREVYEVFKKKGIKKNGIIYAPINFLRMEMYKELSQPQGEIARWEKVLKRLALINKYYPIHNPKCSSLEFMRDFSGEKTIGQKLYKDLKEILIEQGVVFFGGYASNLYSRYMPSIQKKIIKNIPDFDVLALDAKKTAESVKKELAKDGFKIEIIKKNAIWKLIPIHYEIMIDEDVLCVIYETTACHSYNTIHEQKRKIKVASIDTMLNFLFAFYFKDDNYYDQTRVMCMAEYLFQVQTKNRLSQKGLLKRFSVKCYGEQRTIEKVREIKAEKYKLLKNKNSREYQKYFLKYNPLEEIEREEKKEKDEKKSKKKREKKLIKFNKKTRKFKLSNIFKLPGFKFL